MREISDVNGAKWLKLNSWTTVNTLHHSGIALVKYQKTVHVHYNELKTTKIRKIFEDLIKQVNENINSHGAEVSLKSVLYKYGIISKFGGGYKGSACDIIMSNEKLHEEIIAMNSYDNFQSILRIIKNYRLLNSVMSMSDSSQK